MVTTMRSWMSWKEKQRVLKLERQIKEWKRIKWKEIEAKSDCTSCSSAIAIQVECKVFSLPNRLCFVSSWTSAVIMLIICFCEAEWWRVRCHNKELIQLTFIFI